jgi:hypothetical protein
MVLASSVAVWSGCDAQRPNDAALLRRLSSGCNPRLTFVWVGPDSIPRDSACLVATAALNYIGRGGGEQVGVSRTDTAVLSRVIVVRMDMAYPNGEPTRYYWEVDFARPNAMTSITVRIDRMTGAFDAKLAEPIDWPP